MVPRHPYLTISFSYVTFSSYIDLRPLQRPWTGILDQVPVPAPYVHCPLQAEHVSRISHRGNVRVRNTVELSEGGLHIFSKPNKCPPIAHLVAIVGS